MKYITLLSALFATAQAKLVHIVTSYETPIIADMMGVNATGPFEIGLYTTNCELIEKYIGNVTHYNENVGWIIETDIGGGYYDQTSYNKNENTYFGNLRIYSDPSYSKLLDVIVVDACSHVL
ncbi:hypothetical protein AYI70_g4184 [Smittium culicis]|uniref:Uncharacterized protein n=2 Tax=Smittium culicis TaxID=133412 RepID=A0A1R1Y0T5_9FUNG|nr:hypothetical protein AYI69_g8140 [Smittium culicis]OMJ20316.1 hypothetical protein AYI70_g4184 [Smittium culicis]